MAIESLMVPQAEPTVERFRTGSVDVAEAVGVTVEAYKLLGYAGDPENVEHDVTTAFEKIASLGLQGRLVVPAPETVSFKLLLDTAEGKRPEGMAEFYIFPNLWTPGTETESYTEEELNQAPEKAIARLALFNAEDSGVDPILLHTGLPFDDYAKEKWGGESTQLDELEADKVVFEEEHPEFGLEVADHRDFAMLALMDRIRGVSPQAAEFILNRGFMRIKELGRRAVDGDSFVGFVSSYGGRLYLAGSSGIVYSAGGVGVLVGPKELDPQAS